jgi:hypothetical protein
LKNEVKKMNLFEKFKKHVMYDPNSSKKKMTQVEKDHKDLGKKGYIHLDPKELRKILKDEGGAAGIDPFLKKFGKDREKEIRDALKVMNDVGLHKDGDYILQDDEQVKIDEIIDEEIRFFLDERKKKKKKKGGKKDACYHKVRSRYAVWPSAYASGALVKCRKVGAKNWGNKSKK